ncbi:MAG: nucleotidyl transferase AbiEii/AbiGii toxin family protein [Tannerella sp.]|jgi:predicted nucleotidyltransferase component of viral defense system|nr:nucleotidyl transferase AbiEii/AbiGii toxin family protein [Tannerella sp.]
MNISILSDKERIELFGRVQEKINLHTKSIEKDWWVTAVLRALFALPYSEHLSFKGGTSLSKCYNLIERFSEDIDIAVYRDFLGYGGNLSKTQINDKLRRAACSFVREKLQFDVATQLENQGIKSDLFSVQVNITSVTTTDPEIIEVHYKSHYNEWSYLKPIVKIEVSGRSMNEPLRKVALQSLIDKEFPDTSFADKPFEVNAVVPERTFLEKICLLHEEFAKPQEFMRTERMSRHLYDLVKLDEAGISETALKNKELYNSIVEHRRLFVGLKGFDYDTLAPKTIKIVPPDFIISEWQQNYETMRETMIYGESLPFNKLMEKIKKLNKKINKPYFY